MFQTKPGVKRSFSCSLTYQKIPIQDERVLSAANPILINDLTSQFLIKIYV